MNGVIEALHIYDERNNPVLSHTYTARPLSATHLLPLYLEQPSPRPSVIYLPNTNPPTLVFGLRHASLLFLLTASSEIEPLLALEFLHRVVDVLEEFVGAPLLAHRVEANYDVVAQLLTEMCDAGTVNTTEPNALRDLVEVEGFMGKLLGNLNLPTKAGFATNFSNSSAPSLLSAQGAGGLATPALPWRRANVRHTSNEMYADLVETLSVTLAPSGRPLAAFAHGTIAFTARVSGVPDVVVVLSGPSGRHNLHSVVERPAFHPCVRLARWRERPGELSFVPPDGRFILAGYEVDLLPFASGVGASGGPPPNSLRLPVNVEVRTGLGVAGSDFEVRLNVNRVFGHNSSALGNRGGIGGGAGRGLGGPHPGTAQSPLLDDVEVTVPLPADVRNLSEIRPTKGDANYSPGDRSLQWRIPAKELASGVSFFGLRCTVVGPLSEGEDGDDDDDLAPTGFGGLSAGADVYDEDRHGYQDPDAPANPKRTNALRGDRKRGQGQGQGQGQSEAEETDDKTDAHSRTAAQNRTLLMPSSVFVNFSVKGWLASGIRVESIALDPRRSRGLGEGVKPFKGVKYLTVSKGGVELRC
ncbi:hypothetical protein VTK73DRAFT_3963 [Phialemonium thermophilum]|uniref:MHD domain-containing protein n=1 Tax=Phialemonium thermophilum TaxID=223376 RepID=A0ABR3Y0G9_9PEZI